eukprot:TRINITY_DN4259_c0_g1_i1.p1 TRINITY_DN4259_c0_g1~~TRINITY_DN4259_c0_g1_i1.p1  ORF type:complete len:202 (+),score=26.20 TRINITY_DN4259_c0_g1_i1:112-717(+)
MSKWVIKKKITHICNSCNESLDVNFFSNNQLRKGNNRKCKQCIENSKHKIDMNSNSIDSFVNYLIGENFRLQNEVNELRSQLVEEKKIFNNIRLDVFCCRTDGTIGYKEHGAIVLITNGERPLYGEDIYDQRSDYVILAEYESAELEELFGFRYNYGYVIDPYKSLVIRHWLAKTRISDISSFIKTKWKKYSHRRGYNSGH